ncbi:hypothetical protein CMUST_03540 [Corynebacterium mustelae]|uniref:Uncharacterized protein n=1 Tax=Corynebacterium mustelae TaxID=571915 RepID=A0A0G3H1R3_9CORY|nr:hypothetical protein [Corynebacterium mustelae]AKK05052.1 hypothetical protein CMUST_03540 [Corynebacterium mustelae]
MSVDKFVETDAGISEVADVLRAQSFTEDSVFQVSDTRMSLYTRNGDLIQLFYDLKLHEDAYETFIVIPDNDRLQYKIFEALKVLPYKVTLCGENDDDVVYIPDNVRPAKAA